MSFTNGGGFGHQQGRQGAYPLGRYNRKQRSQHPVDQAANQLEQMFAALKSPLARARYGDDSLNLSGNFSGNLAGA